MLRRNRNTAYASKLTAQELAFDADDVHTASTGLRMAAMKHRVLRALILTQKCDLRDTYLTKFNQLGAERKELVRILEGYACSPRDKLSADTKANILRWTQEAEVLAGRLRGYDAAWSAEQTLLSKWYLAHLKEEAKYMRVISHLSKDWFEPGPDQLGDGNGAAT